MLTGKPFATTGEAAQYEAPRLPAVELTLPLNVRHVGDRASDRPLPRSRNNAS